VPDFKDHFSRGPQSYTDFRPVYPEALFDLLAQLAPERRLAWDCATGGGQAAGPLAERFERTVATDASFAQLSARVEHPGVGYAAALAEVAPLPSRSVDLVAVSQALHWFSFDRFYAEAERVLVPGGVLAAWTYPLLRIEPAIDDLIDELHSEIVGDYWPVERRWVDACYEGIPFPYEPLETPPLEITVRWSHQRLMSYLGTWSSVARYREAEGADPLPAFARRLRAAWSAPERDLTVRWRLVLLAGRKER
jgi:SAM-dependent methyltransferase